MMPGWERWAVSELPLLVLAAIGAHLVSSAGQTLLHRWLGHRRWAGRFFRNHIDFHHAYYARGHLTSAVYRGEEGNNTPFFLIPVLLAGSGLFFLLPHEVFAAAALGGAASFAAHVYFDKVYHVSGTPLERFAWFRRKQQLHFVHHLHANTNFAVIDFFWDRLLGTYRAPDEATPERPPAPARRTGRAILVAALRR